MAPLILITIDDLESLESSLSNFTLVSLLRSYSAATPDRLVSLHNFLSANSDRFPLTRNRSLAATWNEMVEESIKSVFPTHNTA